MDGGPADRPAWWGQCSSAVLIGTWVWVGRCLFVEALRICAEVTSAGQDGQEVTGNSCDMPPTRNTAWLAAAPPQPGDVNMGGFRVSWPLTGGRVNGSVEALRP